MKKETYIKLMEYLRCKKALKILVNILYTVLPVVMFLVYPVIVVLNGVKGIDHRFILSIVVPAVTLAGVYVMRKLINRERPYEKFATASLIAKAKKGQSFPSNHAACGFVIAMAGFTVNPILGFSLYNCTDKNFCGCTFYNRCCGRRNNRNIGRFDIHINIKNNSIDF